ncbi:hypothetical protein ACFZCY_43450 [Streptomyces sp. NPDC007983]|uniref:hypothetical protein n=1 Tax=Streptomyces sp. NPDC007983 TaxID=3364800 RepID=UPI0036E175FA
MALSSVRDGERADYAQRLEAFADRHHERLKKICAHTGQGAAPPNTAGTRWSASPKAW